MQFARRNHEDLRACREERFLRVGDDNRRAAGRDHFFCRFKRDGKLRIVFVGDEHLHDLLGFVVERQPVFCVFIRRDAAKGFDDLRRHEPDVRRVGRGADDFILRIGR